MKKIANKEADFNWESDDDSIAGTTKRFATFNDSEDIKDIFKTVVETGFPKLDEILGGGFTPGWAVLGAVSNLGKSTFALQLAANMATKGTPVLFFSLEMPKEWICAKLISQQSFKLSEKNEKSAVMAKDLMNKKAFNANKEKWDVIKQAAKTATKNLKNLYIIDAKSSQYSGQKLTAEFMAEHIKKFIDEHDAKPFVIIDYLQIIPMMNERDASSDMHSIDHNIDVLSKVDKDITVLLISSVSRSSYNSKESLEAIRLDSFKGSGTIEYSADVVLALDFIIDNKSEKMTASEWIMRAKTENPRRVRVMALKQRYNASGGAAAIPFDYYAKFDYFEESTAKSDSSNKTKEESKKEGKSNADSQKKTNGEFDFFRTCKKKTDLKRVYRALSKIYHSDEATGDDAIMQTINQQFEEASNRLDK